MVGVALRGGQCGCSAHRRGRRPRRRRSPTGRDISICALVGPARSVDRARIPHFVFLRIPSSADRYLCGVVGSGRSSPANGGLPPAGVPAADRSLDDSQLHPQRIAPGHCHPCTAVRDCWFCGGPIGAFPEPRTLAGAPDRGVGQGPEQFPVDPRQRRPPDVRQLVRGFPAGRAAVAHGRCANEPVPLVALGLAVGVGAGTGLDPDALVHSVPIPKLRESPGVVCPAGRALRCGGLPVGT